MSTPDESASDAVGGSASDSPAAHSGIRGAIRTAWRGLTAWGTDFVRGHFKAPPRGLPLTALLVFVFPWDDVLIDAVGKISLPLLGVYGFWIGFDCLLIAAVLAAAPERPVLVWVGVTFVLDAITAAVYQFLSQYSAADDVAAAILDVAYVVFIWMVLKVVVSDGDLVDDWRGKVLGFRVGEQTADTPGKTPLWRFAVPLVASVALAYVAGFAATLTCPTSHLCNDYGPPIAQGFYDKAADIIPVLLIALAIEAGLLTAQHGPEERTLVTVTVIGLAVGIVASLTATAADANYLPLTFPLTVQALALGLVTIVMLPSLKIPQRTS